MSQAETFLREQFPELFNRGVENLRRRRDDGSEGAARRLEDIEAARGVAWVQLEGSADLFLVVQDGECTVAPTRPAELPVRVAVAIPVEAADAFLAEARKHADLTSDDAAHAAARTASGRVEQALGGEPLLFHLILKETPDFEEVVVRVGLAADAPPAEPRFTATIEWDDLEAVRRGDRTPQQLFMGGRVRLGGDYSRAMQLAMQLAQAPR